MTDWIRVFLGWDREEEESGAETLLREQDKSTVTGKRADQAQMDTKEAEAVGGTREDVGALRAVTTEQRQTAEQSSLTEDEKGSGGGKAQAGEGEEPEESGAAALERELWQGERSENAAPSSAGSFARAGQEAEELVWRRAGQETMEAVTAAGQAEEAAARSAGQVEGGSRQLEEALDRPVSYQTPAGLLLRTMVVTEQAASYRTVERMASQEANLRWQGADPARLDRIFERDARRYDSGFRLY